MPNFCYLLGMTKLEKIEMEIASLGPADLRKLAEWFAEYRADLWDKQIEEDAKAGKLDKLFAEAEADIAAGKVRPL
jgi:hypothetical protein